MSKLTFYSDKKNLDKRQPQRGLAALRLLIALVMVVGMAGLAALPAWAQGGSRELTPGQAVTGVLNTQTFAQVYTFAAQPGNYAVTAQAQGADLRLALVVSAADGQIIAQAANLNGPEVALPTITIATAGTYFLTVLRATGAQGDAAGNFTLTLTGASGGTAGATPPPTDVPQTVSLAQGLGIELDWNTIDDLNLEVRDPVGGAVFFNNTRVPSGGTYAGNVNGGCTGTVTNATERVTWPRGDVPLGSYEIIVYYPQACVQPAAPREFTVTITVNGQRQAPITATLNPDEQYVASFFLDGADAVTVNPGGPNPLLLNLQPFADEIGAPTPLGAQNQVQSRIDRDNIADVWSFETSAPNQIVTIDMQATSGSLDPQLILLGPDRAVIQSNDDATPETRNALINQQRLPVAGNYLIVATRFGKNIGGTEGNYTLSLTGLTGAPVAANPTLAPPPAVTGTPGTPAAGAPTLAVTAASAPSSASSIGSGLPAGAIEIGLLWDNRADLRLLIRDPEKRSLFSDVRTLPNGAALVQQSNLNCQNTTTAPITYAYWPRSVRLTPGTYEIQVWLNQACNEIALPNYTLQAVVNGNQIIDVDEQPDPTGLLYVATFTVNSDGTATAGEPRGIFTRSALTDIGDYSAQLAAAPVLVYGRAVAGTIDTTTPFSVYTFQGRAGDRVRIQMRATRGNLDTALWLLDGTGVQLLFNDDLEPGRNTNSQINADLPADGGYVIIATRFGALYGGTSGTYELSIVPR